MKRWLILFALWCLIWAPGPASAHRLDEYLQATILSIEPGSVHASLRLVPGIAVAPAIIADIDRNGDGIFSEEEQQAYVKRLLHDLTLEEDGRPLQLNRLADSFPSVDQMRSGLGEVQITLAADRPAGAGKHQIVFANKHQKNLSVYLVNTLVPEDPGIRIESQERSFDQSTYGLTVSDAATGHRL